MPRDWNSEKRYRESAVAMGLCISHGCYNAHRPNRQKCEKCAAIANVRERNRRKSNPIQTFGNVMLTIMIPAVTSDKLMTHVKNGTSMSAIVEEIVEVAVEAMDNE